MEVGGILQGIMDWGLMFVSAVWGSFWSIVDISWPIALVVIILAILAMIWGFNLIVNSTWSGTMLLLYLGIGGAIIVVVFLVWTQTGIATGLSEFLLGFFGS